MYELQDEPEETCQFDSDVFFVDLFAQKDKALNIRQVLQCFIKTNNPLNQAKALYHLKKYITENHFQPTFYMLSLETDDFSPEKQ